MATEPVRRADGSSAGKAAPQCRRRVVQASGVVAPAPWVPSQDAALRLDHHPPVSIAVPRSFLARGSSGPCVLQAHEGGLPMYFS